MSRIPGCLIVGIFLLCSCSKAVPSSNDNSHPSSGDVKVSVTIDIFHPGGEIPADFTGLSFETSALTHATYLGRTNLSFVNLLSGLGHGILRVGGNSADRTFWAGNKPATGANSGALTNSDIDRFFGFAAAVDWKVMYALNLGSDSLPMAIAEAKYVYDTYSSQLACFEMGNEPDLYGRNGLRPSSYSYTDFRAQFDMFYDAITVAVPGALFSGPASAENTNTWMVPFVHDEFNRVKWVTQHYYKMGPPTNPAATISKLLDGNSGIISQAGTMRAAARAHHLPFRIAECNSVYGGGKMGVSNTMAAALWGLDYMFVLAEQGAAGVNFHGGGAGAYTPIAYSGGQFTAQPLYYGMLFFSRASGGNLLPVITTGADSLNLTAHAVREPNGTVRVTLINKDLSKEAFVTLIAGVKPIQSGRVLRLRGPAPNSETGIMLGGAMVNSDGTWSARQTENAAIGVNSCTVKIPACSAVLLTLQ